LHDIATEWFVNVSTKKRVLYTANLVRVLRINWQRAPFWYHTEASYDCQPLLYVEFSTVYPSPSNHL